MLISHVTFCHLRFIRCKALCVPRLGRKPIDESKKTDSNIGSNRFKSVAWTILSFWELMPKGRLDPSGLGIQTFLMGEALYLWVLNSSASFSSLPVV